MSFLNPRYPNLELLEYKVLEKLKTHKEFMDCLNKKKEINRHAGIEFNVTVFPQVWGSTCTGFDITPTGEPVIAGCAMTKEYTTIFHEVLTDTYVVCFGDRTCYCVRNATEEFFEDMKNHNMSGLHMAKKRY